MSWRGEYDGVGKNLAMDRFRPGIALLRKGPPSAVGVRTVTTW